MKYCCSGKGNFISHESLIKIFARKKKMRFVTMLLAQTNRIRVTWMSPCTDAWFTMADASLDDQEWYKNFRVSRKTFQYMLGLIEDKIHRQDTRLRASVSTRCRVSMSLYYLSSTTEYRTIANLFGVSPSFVCICVREVFQAIVDNMMSSFIFLPKGEELEEIIKAYKEKWGFPMCSGAIDGTHIPILAPTDNHSDYINRKGYHSIVVEAVVDCNYLFRDIVIGWPGSVHDARVLGNSRLYQRGNEGRLFTGNVSEDISDTSISPFLLGDPAFPLLSWLMKGYIGKSNSCAAHRTFNYRLSCARMTVENTFGRWKGRFRRFLKRVDMNVENVAVSTMASCILHNLCELSHEDVLEDWLAEIQADGLDQPDDDQFQEIPTRVDAVNIRSALTDFFASQQ